MKITSTNQPHKSLDEMTKGEIRKRIAEYNQKLINNGLTPGIENRINCYRLEKICQENSSTICLLDDCYQALWEKNPRPELLMRAWIRKK